MAIFKLVISKKNAHIFRIAFNFVLFCLIKIYLIKKIKNQPAGRPIREVHRNIVGYESKRLGEWLE
jgi:hypothetical protein